MQKGLEGLDSTSLGDGILAQYLRWTPQPEVGDFRTAGDNSIQPAQPQVNKYAIGGIPPIYSPTLDRRANPTRSLQTTCVCGFAPVGLPQDRKANLKQHKRSCMVLEQHNNPQSGPLRATYTCDFPNCGSKFSRSDYLSLHQVSEGHTSVNTVRRAHSSPPQDDYGMSLRHSGRVQSPHLETFTLTPEVPTWSTPGGDAPLDLNYTQENTPFFSLASESTNLMQADVPKNYPQQISIGQSVTTAQTKDFPSHRMVQASLDWESRKELIHDLYVVKRHGISKIMTILSKEHGFWSTERRLRAKIEVWGFDKRIKKKDIISMIAKRQSSLGKEIVFSPGRSLDSRASIAEKSQRPFPQKTPNLTAADSTQATPSDVEYCSPLPESVLLPSPKPFDEHIEHSFPAAPALTGSFPHDFAPLPCPSPSPKLFNKDMDQVSSHDLGPESWVDAWNVLTRNEVAPIASVSAQRPSDLESSDSDVLTYLEFALSMFPSSSSFADNQQNNDESLGKGDVPFTDSGYKSALNLDYSQNSQLALVKSPHPFNPNSTIARSPQRDGDAKTTYSTGSTVDPGYARMYIIEICNDMHSKLLKFFDATNRSALTVILPELVKAFAIKLCHDAPSENSHIHRELMYFIHKRHKEIAAQLQAMFNNDDVDQPDRHEGHSGDMHFLDKMKMWRNNAEQDHSAPPNNELFEGVQDDDEDPIDQSKLSTYHKIILDSTAYEWFLQSAAIEASVNFETSQPRIRQQILDKLPTGTVSKRRSPKVYEVRYSFEWQPSMGDRLQDMFSEASQRTIQPIRSSIVMTGSPHQAQGLTIKQYLAQTWPMTGPQVWDALVKSNTYPNTNYNVNLLGNTQLEIVILSSQLIVTATGSAYSVAECGELLAWIGSALLNDSQNISSSCLPLINLRSDDPTSSSASLKYKGHCDLHFRLTRMETWNESLPGVQNFSRDLLGENTIILGFPIRRRPENYPGLEVSFGTLLLYLEASIADVFVFDVFIKGPKRVLKLTKHSNGVFLWQLDHSLGDYSLCCSENQNKAVAINDYSSLDYQALETGRHILSKCADHSAPIKELHRHIDEPLVNTKTSRSNSPAEMNLAHGQNLSSCCPTVRGNHGRFSTIPKPRDNRTASRLPSIGSSDSLLESYLSSPASEIPGCFELRTDAAKLFSAVSQVSPRIESCENSLDSDMFSISDSSDDFDLLNPEENTFASLNNILQQLLVGFRIATNYQLSPGAGESTSGRVLSTTMESAQTVITSRPVPKRKLPQDEEDSAGEDESSRRRSKKRKSDQDDDSEKSFACPFLKWNPVKHSNCCVKKLSSISYVKQHLVRSHTPPRYCQTCHSTDFLDEDSLQSHLDIRNCTSRRRTMLDGISYSQRSTLTKKSKPRSSKEEQWYAIWNVLFSKEPRPSSVYVDTSLDLELQQFRDYCERHGPAIIRGPLEADPTFLGSGITADQRHVLDRIIAQGITTLFDNWSSRSLSTSTSPECQSNRNPGQSQYETPTNSLVDSGVGMGNQSFADSRLGDSELPPLSMTIPMSSATQPATAKTQARDFLSVPEIPAGLANMQGVLPASLDFNAAEGGWLTGFQGNNGFGDFDLGELSSLGDFPNSDFQPSQTYWNGGPYS